MGEEGARKQGTVIIKTHERY